MAKSKSPLYPQEDQLTSMFAFALSHPARINILEKLAEEGECTVQKLRKNHPVSMPTLSQHLKILRKAQLIQDNEKFPYTYYEVIMPNLQKAKKLLNDFFQKVEIHQPVENYT